MQLSVCVCATTLHQGKAKIAFAERPFLAGTISEGGRGARLNNAAVGGRVGGC